MKAEHQPRRGIIARYLVIEIVLAVVALAVLGYRLAIPDAPPWLDAATIIAGIVAWLVFRMRQPRPPSK